MDIARIFLERYDPLYNFWIGGLWTEVPAELLRVRPHPQLNSIAWNLWHLTRVEDTAVNCFVANLPQVLDAGATGDASALDVAGDWAQRMNIPWRHNGSGMTFAEVDELDARIDLAALLGYSQAVEARTRAVIAELDRFDLDATLDEPLLAAPSSPRVSPTPMPGACSRTISAGPKASVSSTSPSPTPTSTSARSASSPPSSASNSTNPFREDTLPGGPSSWKSQPVGPNRSVFTRSGSCPSSTNVFATNSTSGVGPHTYTSGRSAGSGATSASMARSMRRV